MTKRKAKLIHLRDQTYITLTKYCLHIGKPLKNLIEDMLDDLAEDLQKRK